MLPYGSHVGINNSCSYFSKGPGDYDFNDGVRRVCHVATADFSVNVRPAKGL